MPILLQLFPPGKTAAALSLCVWAAWSVLRPRSSTGAKAAGPLQLLGWLAVHLRAFSGGGGRGGGASSAAGLPRATPGSHTRHSSEDDLPTPRCTREPLQLWCDVMAQSEAKAPPPASAAPPARSTAAAAGAASDLRALHSYALLSSCSG